ncbi:hypothetical protein [Emergencia timonensis]|nr:hypothetical protein [Emergencia timonensis]
MANDGRCQMVALLLLANYAEWCRIKRKRKGKIIMCEAWISFAGTVLGGGLTLLGVAITIRYYKAQEAKDAESERNAGIMMFYNFLLTKVNLLKKIYDYRSDDERKTIIQGGCVYTESENLFLYERIHYLKSIVSEDELLELLAFMGQLQQYEAVRRNCEIELDKNNMVIHTIEYNKQLDNCYGRLDTDSEKGICGILDILCKIEAYLENGKK